MHWSQNLRKLHVDLTSYCNAKCPACARNLNGGPTTPGLALEHFEVDVWNQLAKDTAGNIHKLFLNGNWGDPGMHPNLIEMLATFGQYHTDCDLVICTNGGMHKPEWWSELATVLKDRRHRVVWSIDGIGKSHELYRRNTSYDRVIENMQAFNSAGGASEWVMTLWDHNLHEIDTVRELAKDLGCYWLELRDSHSPEELLVTDNDKRYEYTLYTKKAKDVKSGLEILNKDQAEKFRKDLRLDFPSQTEFKCPWYNEYSIQIDPFMKVWPCCNISIYTHIKGHPLDQQFDVTTLPEDGFNDLSKQSIYEILEHPWWDTTLSTAIDKAEYKVCRNSCGVR